MLEKLVTCIYMEKYGDIIWLPEEIVHVVRVGVHDDVSYPFLLDFSQNISEKNLNIKFMILTISFLVILSKLDEDKSVDGSMYKLV